MLFLFKGNLRIGQAIISACWLFDVAPPQNGDLRLFCIFVKLKPRHPEQNFKYETLNSPMTVCCSENSM